MIVFLTLCYLGVLLLLIKFKVIKPTLFWKLSPLIFVNLCLVLLFIPMQWGAPSGTVNVYQGVVEIVPEVSGEVIDVPAVALEPMSRGDVLFTIDPRSYQSEVDRLQAALQEAEQTALMLPVNLAAAQSNVDQAEAALVAARNQAEALNAALAGAQATVAKFEAQLQLAQVELDRAIGLRANDAIAQQELDTEQRNFDAAKATLDEAVAGRDQAQLAVDSQIDGVNTLVLEAQAALAAAQAQESKAQLALDSTINGENTSVAQLRAQLEAAQLNLDFTTVRAPDDGYLVGLSLRPGQRVGNFPMRGWMTFVEPSRTRLSVTISQNTLRHVKPGQPAEVIFKLFPGRTLSAKVEAIVHITAEGQLEATGEVPTASAMQQLPYFVILTLDDEDFDLSELPGGAGGTAAIYTDNMQMTHVIRRVELRMESWLNFVIP